MTNIAITIDDLSKRYRIGSYVASYGRLTESVWQQLSKLFLREGMSESAQTSIWALRDFSLEVREGEILGIVGRNGAGKTTLLKILSRITEPTSGSARLYGRVGSLLEVGTGFHPELTGRENIYLNGAILGMDKREIDWKFDDIVGFAEIEKFIDTPIKRYSSGMYVRLAFAVAAHLETEILLVDEVLAVGDLAFQKKCLAKMNDLSKTGQTVLFVSHNMAAIDSLCDRVLRLDEGRLVDDGRPSEVIGGFIKSMESLSLDPVDSRKDRSGDRSVRLDSLRIESCDPDGVIRSGSRLRVSLSYSSPKPLLYPQFLVGVYDYKGTGIFLLDSGLTSQLPLTLPSCGTVQCLTDPINLTAGRCFVNVAIQRSGIMADHVEHALDFDITAGNIYGSGKLPPREWVMCVLPQQWKLNGE